MESPRLLSLSVMIACVAPLVAGEDTPQAPGWAQPGSATRQPVAPPADFGRPGTSFGTPIGVFDGRSDIGSALVQGSANYDAATGAYTIHSAGCNDLEFRIGGRGSRPCGASPDSLVNGPGEVTGTGERSGRRGSAVNGEVACRITRVASAAVAVANGIRIVGNAMKARFRFLGIGILCAFSFAFASSLRSVESGDRPIGVDAGLEEVIPLELKAMLLVEPFVRFFITVNKEGALVDHLAVFATHYGLLERAEKRLLRAKFSPALSGGVPVQASTDICVTFFDPEQRAFHSGLISRPSGSTSMDAAVRWMSEAGKKSLEYGVSQPDELDHPLEILEAKILVMTDAEGRPAEGGCVVEFFIDNRGEVRLPRVVTSDNVTVSTSALLTVLETHFAPITRHGRPTYVKVRQPMEFHPSSP